MTSSISAQELPIKKILSPDFGFRIPAYQRPYSWTTEQANTLLSDLLSALEDFPDETSVDKLPVYFLGSIVLIRGQENVEFDVVDGQQRLTTLTILLACLRDSIADPNVSGAIQGLIFQSGNPVTGDMDRFRLILRSRDKDFFEKNVQRPGTLQALTENGAELSDSQSRIRENAAALFSATNRMSEDKKKRLAAFIIQRCFLVAVSADSRDSAYRIFSVMNDRGLDLTPSDILKADILGEAADNGATEAKLTKIWEDNEIQLGRESFESLFGHIRMIFSRQKAKKSIIESFREDVFSKIEAKNFIEQVLVPYAEAFGNLLDGSVPLKGKLPALDSSIRALGRLDNSDWIPPAIHFLKANAGSPEKLLEFFTSLERFAYVLFLRRAYSTERVRRYGEVLQAIDEGTILIPRKTPFDVPNLEKKEAFSMIDGNIYSTTRVVLPVLLKLDELMSDGGAVYQRDVISVEHVMPQTIRAGSEWEKQFPDHKTHQKWLHRVGNLVLLPRRKNTQASNYDFEKKRDVYFSYEKVAPFAITTGVLKQKTWTVADIENRHQEMVKILRDAWKL